MRRGLREHKFSTKYGINEVNLPKTLIAEVIKDFDLLPKNYKEALTIPHWHKVMDEEYKALKDNNT